MIGRLHGRIVSEGVDGLLVVDVGGVGYEVLVPLGTGGRCPRDDDGRVTLLVVTQVREDAITLYGFAHDGDRAAFRHLTAVTGVGPRTAVAVLSLLPVQELVGTILKSDARKLMTVPGVGKKLAERVILELKDKVAAGAIPVPPTGPSSDAAPSGTPGAPGVPVPVAAPVPAGPLAQLSATLQRLGFKPAEAERAAAELAPSAHLPLDALVREALRVLTR
jgi:Holliday junction DNA helicase RuvA